MFFVRPEYRDSIWSCWNYNPFHKITKDSVLKSSLLKRFTDTFRVLGGKFRSKDTDINKQVGLIEYLLIPIDIIENLLYYSFIGRPIAYLLMGIHIILEGTIAGILTAVLTPVILITHVACQLINFFAPPPTTTHQSTKANLSRNHNRTPTFTHEHNKSPISQPKSQETGKINKNKAFIWVAHSLGGKYTILKDQKTDKHLFFWLNNSNDLYVTENEASIKGEQYNASLWGDAVVHDYSIKQFETDFPNISNANYQNYQPINSVEIPEDTITGTEASHIL